MSGAIEIQSFSKFLDHDDVSLREGCPQLEFPDSAATGDVPKEADPGAVVSTSNQLPDWFGDVVNEIFGQTNLPNGWDSYKGRAASLETAIWIIDKLRDVSAIQPNLGEPKVIPSPDAGIELYWSNPKGSLSLSANDAGVRILEWIEAGSRKASREHFSRDALEKFLQMASEYSI